MARESTVATIDSSPHLRLRVVTESKKTYVRLLSAVLLGVAILTVSGCATTGTGLSEPRPQPVRIASIVEWSRQSLPPATIIDRIRRSGTVYHLNVGQMIKLHKEGVPNVVLDYMQGTYVDAVSRNRARMDIRNWYRYHDGYYYGGPAYGWEWPSFNFDEEGGDEGN